MAPPIIALAILLSHNGICSTCNPRPEISTFLSDGASNSRTFHLALWIDDNTSIIFEIHEDTILSAPWLALPNNNSRQDLLPEIRLAFLDGGHNHITNTC